MSELLRVGITHGDINGISYEVIIKALSDERMLELMTPIVFGSEKVLEFYKRKLGVEDFNVHVIKSLHQAKAGVVNWLDVCDGNIKAEPGEATEASGSAALQSLESACEALEGGGVDVLVTAPINKHAIHGDAFHFAGHTEYLESRFRGEAEGMEADKAMMVLFAGGLRVALLTSHIPLREVADHISEDEIVEAVKRFNGVLQKDFRVERPKIAVMSVDPHCGDMGTIGTMDEEIVKPAVNRCFEEGYMAFGPFAADGLFGSHHYRDFDGILALYHDQGLAPFKALAGSSGVNFTGGLRYIRTSPDHGTGYDIAGQNRADAESMRCAIYEALDIYRARRAWEEAHRNPLSVELPTREERGERR